MTDKLTECGQIKQLLPLRVSEDLDVDDAAKVDQHTRYCEGCRKRLHSFSIAVGVLREVGAASTPVDGRDSLWDKLEPRLGPAGRQRARPLSWVSTRQLALACALLIGLTIYLEGSSGVQQGDMQPSALAPTSGNEFASQHPVAVIRPMLGVAVQEVDGVLAKRLGLPMPQGALVAHVIPASSADLAGLQTADVILSVDEVMVRSPQHLATMIGGCKIGTTLKMQILRDGRVIEREVLLGAQQSRRADAPEETGQRAQVASPIFDRQPTAAYDSA